MDLNKKEKLAAFNYIFLLIDYGAFGLNFIIFLNGFRVILIDKIVFFDVLF